MAGKVTLIDRGWNSIRSNLRHANGSHTKVGIQQGSTSSKDGKVSDLVMIAAANEFGTSTIPSRPALRQAFDNNRSQLSSVTQQAYDKMITGMMDSKAALGLIGEWMSDRMKRQITALRTPPNAPATIARKKSSNPLIDTGQYRNSISHVEVMS
ncbi:MAG: hypothetical protein HC773_05230 [Scytonema sp. CRU_2_7]|nr:hypothetical protein [Scytonema sp. CRU_2_7]